MVRQRLGDLQGGRSLNQPGIPGDSAEHGLSPDPKVAKWQDRLTPFQRRWAGGCHLNRPIGQLIEGAGFTVPARTTTT